MKKRAILFSLFFTCFVSCAKNISYQGHVVGEPVFVSEYVSYVLVEKDDGHLVEAIVPINQSLKNKQRVRLKLLDKPVKVNNLVIAYYAEEVKLLSLIIPFVLVVVILLIIIFIGVGDPPGSEPYVGGIATACANSRS